MKLSKHLILVILCILTLDFRSASAQNPKPCRPGQFKDGKTCVKCPINTYSNKADSRRCKPCPPRSFTRAGSRAFENCKFCRPGTFFNETAEACQPCPINTFNSKTDASECIPCPSGTVSRLGRPSRSECVTCPIGTVVDRQQARIIRCKSCPAGQTTFKMSSEVCEKCPIGTFRERAKFKDLRCTPCRVGTFTNKTGSLSCTPCSVGFFQDEVGKSSCKKCPPDSTTKREGARVCQPTCDPRKGDCEAKPCMPGFGYNSETRSCEECPRGTINPRLSTTPCFPCPVGDGTVNLARTKCVCKTGFRLQENGTCKKCESGFSTGDGNMCMCVLNDQIDDRCQCPPLSKLERNRCIPCNPKIEPECEGCFGRGQVFNKAARRCEECPANTFVPDRETAIKCRPCPGDSTSMPGSDRCSCDAGKGFKDAKCAPCPFGTFSQKRKEGRRLACQRCGKDEITEGAGSVRCQRCPRKTNPNDEKSACVPE